MPTKLTQTDRDAIDALLDKNASGYAGRTVSPDHLRAAERVLNLLGTCAVDEPGNDLAARTMARIEGTPVVRTTTIGAPFSNIPHA